MSRKAFLAVAAAVLLGGAASAGGKLFITRADVPAGGPSFTVFDATGGGAAEAVSALLAGQYDAVIAATTAPLSVCDDASDCADAVEEVCALLGTAVATVAFDKKGKSCSGSCDNSVTVHTVCPTASEFARIVID